MLIILGAGGFAREAYFHILDYYSHNNLTMPELVFYDGVSGIDSIKINGTVTRVISNFTGITNAEFTIAVNDPNIKRLLVKQALQAGLQPADTIIHPSATVQDKQGIRIQKGGIIAPGCHLTTNIQIGNYVIFNLSCTVGHDSVIESYVSVNPGVHISGNTVIREGSVIGTGAAIIEKISIAEDVIIGAQSCVTKDLVEGKSTYYGVPVKMKPKNLTT